MTKKRYIVRALEPVLQRAAREFPAVVLTGPRQSGKTTLLKHLFLPDYRYVSLEPPDIQSAARRDPRGLLDAFPPPVILDEIQYALDLLMYVKERIDAQRERTGQYVLTGSQNLLLARDVAETLAGRAAMLRLLPLSRRETAGCPNVPLCWEQTGTEAGNEERRVLFGTDLWEAFLRGSYPELTANLDRDSGLWHASYVQTYLERDVRSLRQVGDLSLFQDFLRMLAARSGQLLNLADLGRDLGAALNTIRAWLSILEATFQVFILRPYFANIGKRLVKTPKVYFTDLGTLCYLAGLRDPEHAACGPMAGAIMETAVLSEIVKTLIHRGEEPRLHFWRTASGSEVDILVESEGQLIPIEVKLSSTPNANMGKGIAGFQRDLGSRSGPGYVVHPGNVRLPLTPGVQAIPFGML